MSQMKVCFTKLRRCKHFPIYSICLRFHRIQCLINWFIYNPLKHRVVISQGINRGGLIFSIRERNCPHMPIIVTRQKYGFMIHIFSPYRSVIVKRVYLFSNSILLKIVLLSVIRYRKLLITVELLIFVDQRFSMNFLQLIHWP